jgi:thioredoxin-like negative regulator of GroEL
MEDVIMKTLFLSLLAALFISVHVPVWAMDDECTNTSNEPENVTDQAIYWKKKYTDLLQTFVRHRVKEAHALLKTLGRGKNLVVFAYTKNCPLCQRMKPIITELKAELQGNVAFMNLNVDKYKTDALLLGIKNTPAYIVVKDGVRVGDGEGFVEKEDFKEDLEDVFHPELAKECDECIEECPEE